MCRASQLFRAGAWAAEEIAARSGVSIAKALNPLDSGDFLTICVRLASSLRGAVKGTEAAALKSVIETLDVDWPSLSEDGRNKIIAAARNEVRGLASTVPKLVEPVLTPSAVSLVSRTRVAAVARFGLSAQLRDEAPVDRETVEALPGNQMVYVKDQYGTRSDAVDAMARQIVSSGLERGLGRDDISEELARRMGGEAGILRTGNYWDLIATDFANKARTSTQLNTFERAQISRYRFDAVLDEATSEICRLLHGRVFSVTKAAKRMRTALAAEDPEQIKTLRPWVQAGKDDAGNSILYFNKPDGRRRLVAQVDEPGEGTRDKTGAYSRVLSDKALEAAGVTVPPAHGHCRSTLTAED